MMTTAGLTLAALGTSSHAQSGVTPAEARALAKEAYIWGYPIVDTYRINYDYFVNSGHPEFKATWNNLAHNTRLYTPDDKTIQTINSDTLYSFIGANLRDEPIVITVPAVAKERYYGCSLFDIWGTCYDTFGTRATGNDAGNFMIVGPGGWKGEPPRGIKKIYVTETTIGMPTFRTQLFNSDDVENVKKVQAGYKVQPLSAYLKQPATSAAAAIDFPKIDKELVKTNFFEYLDFALQFAPAGPEERVIREKLARIGVGPGKTFDFKDLPLEHKLEIGLGMKDGDEKVEKYLAGGQKDVNGWKIGSLFGDRLFYSGDWLKRAAAAKGGIYGNDAVEAVYPMTKKLASGEPLDGSKNNYTLTFLADQFPPVNAFWSVTMYDGKTQLLIENPINRYLINSPMLPGMKKNPDGSLTLYIQNKSPGADRESNWLPAPNGDIYLVMRLYWPKTEAPSILPPGNGTWKPPAIALVV